MTIESISWTDWVDFHVPESAATSDMTFRTQESSVVRAQLNSFTVGVD